MRTPKEVEKDEYHEFYKKAFNEFLDPLAYTHFTTEVCSSHYVGFCTGHYSRLVGKFGL